jgi:hypothetical protein
MYLPRRKAFNGADGPLLDRNPHGVIVSIGSQAIPILYSGFLHNGVLKFDCMTKRLKSTAGMTLMLGIQMVCVA